ncbi:hypothetical protein IF2G_11049 [Cordyceps javanica]|nr:hypothetical protein IF2G_11049 [Cordyceps javanica]
MPINRQQAILSDKVQSAGPSSGRPDIRSIGYEIYEDSSWITLDGNNWLWLPTEYRDSQSAICRSTIVLGCRSGKVLIMNFELWFLTPFVCSPLNIINFAEGWRGLSKFI